MEGEKDDIIGRLAKEFLNGMEEKGKPNDREEKESIYPEPPKEREEEHPLPTFEEKKLQPPKIEEEGSLPPFEEPSLISEERPSDEKIEEMLAAISEKESLKTPLKIEEEEEGEEFVEVEDKEDEIFAQKPKKITKKGGRFTKFAILGCLLGAIVGGGIYFGKHYYKYKPAINLNVINKLFKVSCDLIVSSAPDECDLFVDDIFKGKTPITVKRLPSGSHNIRVEKEGFKPFLSIINVRGRKPINITANLSKEQETKIEEEIIPMGTGALIVRTNPKDSLVYINGKRVETPYSLLPGTHSVKVERDGFSKFTKIIEIKPGETKEVFVKLQSLSGSIFIDSIPRGGDAIFSGSFKGKTPLVLTNISPWKPFKITIRKEGYLPWNGTTFVEPNQRTKIVALMKKEEDFEKISLKEGERFVFKKPFYEKEKEAKIEETLPSILSLTREIDRFSHEIKEAAPILPSSIEEPYLKKGAPPIPTITGEAGVCFITSIPPGAEIFLSGRFIGKTPIRDFIIKGGKYELKAVLPGFKEEKKEIIVNNETLNFFNLSLKQ